VSEQPDLEALRRLADAGDEDAAFERAVVLAERGEHGELTQLAELLYERGDLDGLTRLAEAGDEDAADALVRMLSEREDLDALARLAGSGHERAARALAHLRLPVASDFLKPQPSGKKIPFGFRGSSSP
jgi:hypothetical protein